MKTQLIQGFNNNGLSTEDLITYYNQHGLVKNPFGIFSSRLPTYKEGGKKKMFLACIKCSQFIERNLSQSH